MKLPGSCPHNDRSVASLIGDKEDTNVVVGRHDRCASFRARHAHAEILASLRHRPRADIAAHNAIRVADDLALVALRPSFEDDNLIELLALRLVHVHHDDTRLRL